MVELIFYGYDEAPNSRKVLHTLELFRIPFKYCQIPRTWPRPDFQSIDIAYRRSPLFSIDSDMYVDSSLIIDKLCDIAQHTDHHVKDNSNYRAYEAFGREPFTYAVGLIPDEYPVWQDKGFLADRQELVGPGRDFSQEAFKKARPYTISYFCSYLSVIEKSMLKGDGKKFFMGGDLPTMADIYGP